MLASWRDAIPKEVAQSAEKTQPAFETPTSPLSSQANEVLEQILPLLPLATLAHPFKLSKSQILLRNDERDTIEANIASKSTTGTDDETPDPITALSSLRAGVADLHAQSAELAHGYQQRSRTVSKETHEEVESLIRAMGVPLLKTSSESVHEAEALGAVLYHTGDVAAVFTEDTDVLLYDAPIVRDFVGRTKTPTIIHGRELREAFGLDVSAFIDLGLLCGSDFMETIPKVGPVTAFKLIKEHGSIEQILQADADRPKPRCILPDIASYLESLSLAREVFHSPPLLPTEPGVMNSQPVDREALAAILQKYGIDTLPKIPNENFDNLEIPSRISTPASESESEDWPPVRDSRF